MARVHHLSEERATELYRPRLWRANSTPYRPSALQIRWIPSMQCTSIPVSLSSKKFRNSQNRRDTVYRGAAGVLLGFSPFFANNVSTSILFEVSIHTADSPVVTGLDPQLSLVSATTSASAERNPTPLRAGGAVRSSRLAVPRHVRHPLPSQVCFPQKRLPRLFA